MLVRNMVYEAGARVLTILLGLAFVPVNIRYLGLGGFGAWESVTALANLGMVLYAPIASCILWRVASVDPSVRMASARRMALQGAVCCLMASLAYAGVIHWFGDRIAVLLRFPVLSSDGAIPRGLVLGGACLAQGILGCAECFGCALGGLGRLRNAAMVRSVALLVNYLVALLCLSRGMGLSGLMVGLLSMGVVGLGVNCTVLWRMTVEGAGRGQSLITLEGFRYAWTLVIGFLAGIGKDSADRIISAAMASTSFAATLGLANRMTVILGEINRYAYTPLIPAIAAAQASGDESRVRMLFERCMCYNAFASGFLTSILIAGSETILRLWTGVVPENTHLVTVTVAAGVVMQLMLTGPATAVLRGLGRVKFETLYITFALVLNIGLSVLLVPRFAAQGKIAATSISLGAGSLLFVWLVFRARCLVRGPFVSNLVLYGLSMGIGLLFREFWAAFPGAEESLRHGPVALISLGVPGVLFAVLAMILSPSTRRQLAWLKDRLIRPKAA